MKRRRLRSNSSTTAAENVADVVDEIGVDETTQLAARRFPREDVDDSTQLGSRRREENETDTELDEATVLGSRRPRPSAPSEPIADSDDADESFDESTVLSSRREEALTPAGDAVDDETMLGSRAQNSQSNQTPPVARDVKPDWEESLRSRTAREMYPEVDTVTFVEDDLDDDTERGSRQSDGSVDTTVIGSRRSSHTPADDVDETQLSSRRTDEFDDETQVSSRTQDLDETQVSSRRGSSDDTKIGSRQRDVTLRGSRRRSLPFGLDDSGDTDSGSREIPLFDDTLLPGGGRRTVTITADPSMRRAHQPDQAILKKPYKPRNSVLAQVLHRESSGPERSRDFAQSLAALKARRKDARRRVTSMFVTGGVIVVGSAAGIVTLLLLG